MVNQTPYEKIQQRRFQCIVHRILYYVFDDSIIPDHQYDKWERELRELVKEYTEIAAEVPYNWCCPSKCVGSSQLDAYPEHLINKAKWLRENRSGVFERVALPDLPTPQPKQKPAPAPKKKATNPGLKMTTLFNFPKK